jgi:hypothetical protein
MSIRLFRLQLAKQMVNYDPSKGMYPGDEKMRAYTQKHKKRRSSNDVNEKQTDSKKAKNNDVTEVTFDSFERAIHSGRLCLTVNGLQSILIVWKGLQMRENVKFVVRTQSGGAHDVIRCFAQ